VADDITPQAVEEMMQRCLLFFGEKKNPGFILIMPNHSPIKDRQDRFRHITREIRYIDLNIQLLHNLTKPGKSNTFNRHYLFKLNMAFLAHCKKTFECTIPKLSASRVT
jgi:hypothetical protein